MIRQKRQKGTIDTWCHIYRFDYAAVKPDSFHSHHVHGDESGTVLVAVLLNLVTISHLPLIPTVATSRDRAHIVLAGNTKDERLICVRTLTLNRWPTIVQKLRGENALSHSA
jgi:hypothetical protein